MKRVSSYLIILVMIITMIPTAFADETTGYSGVSALTALFLSADLEDVFDAYDTALDYIDDPTTFYSGSPEVFQDGIEVELSEAIFNDLYDGTVAALDGQLQGSKTEVYDDLAGIVSGQAPELVDGINSMDLDLDDGSKVGTLVYYMGKLAQEKKIATYDTYTDKLEFDLGRIPGATSIDVNDGQTLNFGSSSGAYSVSEVAESVFANIGSGFDFDSVAADLEAYLNDQLDIYIAKDAANRQKMVDALTAFGFLHEYSTKPSTGGGGSGGGFILIERPVPAPENPGVVDGDAIEVIPGETVTKVLIDEAAIIMAVEQAVAAVDGTAVEIMVPETAVPAEVGKQVVITIPEAAVEALSAGGTDVVLHLGERKLMIPGVVFLDSTGELNLQFIRTSAPSSLEAAVEDPGLRQVAVTRGLALGFDINFWLVEHTGQTRLTDFSTSPLHVEVPLDNILSAYYDTLGLYRYNHETGYYEFVGGRVEDDKLVAELTHLSEYVILNVVTTFTDMPTHWANAYVRSMAAKHVINGEGTGRFVPEDSVTRAEFVKMLVNVENLPLNGAPSFFEDVEADDWFKPYVDAAYANGLIYGGTVTTFLPEQAATRLEMMVMLSYAIDEEIAEEEVETILSAYTDADQIPTLHRADLAKVIKAGLIEGYNGILSLNDGLKRSEAATVMYRLFNR